MKAYGISLDSKLVAVYLELGVAEQQLSYFRHRGNPVIVELIPNEKSVD